MGAREPSSWPSRRSAERWLEGFRSARKISFGKIAVTTAEERGWSIGVSAPGTVSFAACTTGQLVGGEQSNREPPGSCEEWTFGGVPVDNVRLPESTSDVGPREALEGFGWTACTGA